MPYKSLERRRERYAYLKSLPPEEKERIAAELHIKVAERKAYAQAVKECRLKRRCLKKEMAWFRRKMRKKAYFKTEKGKAIRKVTRMRWYKSEKGIISKRNKNKSPSHKALNALRKAKHRALEKAMTDFDKFVYKQAFHLRKQREKLFGTKWHIDHIVPVSKGGTNEYINFQVVPAKWNLDKSNYHTEKYFK
jgi:5-methylcytosine-specific restriction endonuclease McrA